MLEIITLYERPRDYPEQYVARWFEMDHPTSRFVVADSLEDLKDKLRPDIEHKFYVPGSENDDETVIGSYL